MADVTQVGIVDGIPTSGTGTVDTLIVTNARIGEVQANPTTNTLLDRVKVVHTDLVAIEALLPDFGSAGTASAEVVTIQGIASMTPVQVSDGGGTLTVDAPVGTPVFVRLSDGSAPITTLPVSLASVPSHAVTNAGVFAVQAAQSGTWTVGISAAQTLGTVTTIGTVQSITQIGGTNIVTGGVAGSLGVGGTVATNVAINANPLNLGAQAVSSENAAVTTARQVQLVADLVGKLIVLPYSNPENFVSGTITTSMTATASTLLIAAPASGLRNYITQITVSNAHATVGTDIAIQDGSGGATLYTIPAAAVYGGATLTFPTPLRQPSTATAIYCANVTTGASTKVSGCGYKGA